MAIFGRQFSNVVEWEEYRDDVLFWKWNNNEIKKGSKLVIRPGQDAIFMYNGKIEGIFTDEGSFDIASEIIPFLSTLKGFKFGFNSGIRAEVLFINTKEFTVKWGTKNEINIPVQNLDLPGGLPIRAFGNFSCKISDHQALIDKIAGIKKMFTIDEVKERVLAKLDQLLMKWIVREGKDIADLMVNSFDISKGIREDLDMEMIKLGITITDFNIQSFSYPPEVQEKIQKVASHSMVGDLGRYQSISMVDAMANSKGGSGSGASDMATSMAGMQMGMMMGKQMVDQMESQPEKKSSNQATDGVAPNFCPNCGTKTGGSNFCSNCGTKLV